MRIYVDSDVLIWHLRGDQRARGLLHRLRQEEHSDLWIGAMQRAEIVFFTRPDETETTELLLSQFRTTPVDQSIVDRAGGLFREWHASHGIDANDALLAATAMTTGGRIVTLNVKHYPMPDILVTAGW